MRQNALSSFVAHGGSRSVQLPRCGWLRGKLKLRKRARSQVSAFGAPRLPRRDVRRAGGGAADRRLGRRVGAADRRVRRAGRRAHPRRLREARRRRRAPLRADLRERRRHHARRRLRQRGRPERHRRRRIHCGTSANGTGGTPGATNGTGESTTTSAQIRAWVLANCTAVTDSSVTGLYSCGS